MIDVNAALGRVGLTAPMRELASRDWDVIVVGGGHNGLTAAAYLARAGRSVLVIERRERLGGACTLERPFPDPGYLVSPCAYVVGLLDQLVIDELGLERLGYRVIPADPALWCPFADGSSFASFLDRDRTVAHMEANGFSERDIRGVLGYQEVFGRLRRLLRDGPAGDTWVGASPTRAEIEEILGRRPELVSIVFEESIAETLDRYVDDQRLKDALMGQGVIGTNAGPQGPRHGVGSSHAPPGRPARARIRVGLRRGRHGAGLVRDRAGRARGGRRDRRGSPRSSEILPGEGVELDSGELIRAPTVVSNADPKRTLAMLDPRRRLRRLQGAAGELGRHLAGGQAERGASAGCPPSRPPARSTRTGRW